MHDHCTTRTLAVAAALAVILGAIAVRVVFLACDPPHGLSISRAEYTDEGLKFYQARNRALFGQWRIETPWAMQGHLRTSPVPTVVGWGVFEAFGVGRIQARCVSVVSGVLSCGLLMLIGARSGKWEVGLLAGAFAAVNFIVVSYDRLALFESLFITELMAAAFFFLEGGWRRWVLCPAFLGLAYLTRASAVVVAAAFGAAWLLEVTKARTSPSRRVLLATAALSVLALVVLGAVLLTPGNQILAQVRARFNTPYFQTFPPAVAAADLFVRTFPDSRLAVSMPFLTILALLGASARPARDGGCDAACVRADSGAARSPRVLFCLWLAAAVLLVAFLEYRPTRYYVLLLPAAVWLAAEWIVDAARGGRLRAPSSAALTGWLALRFLAGIGIVGVVLRFAVAFRRELPMFVDIDSVQIERLQDFIESHFIGTMSVLQPRDAIQAAGLVAMMKHHAIFMCLAALTVPAMTWVWALVRRRLLPAGLPPRAGVIAALVIVFAILAAQVSQHVEALEYKTRRYEVLRAEREIAQLIGDNSRACIAGNWAPTLCMGTPYLTIPFARANGNAWETFRRFPVTHFLLEMGSPNEELYLRNVYPLQYERCRLLKTFQMDFYSIGLFEYTPQPGTPVAPWPFEKRAK